MTMENQFFVRSARDYRNSAKTKDPVDKAVEAYCDAVHAEYMGQTTAADVIKTEKSRLAQTKDWEKEDFDVFDRTIELCRSLPLEPMYAESAKGAYAREIKFGE